MSRQPLEPPPPALRRGARRLRAREVPPDLDVRLQRALVVAEREGRGRARRTGSLVGVFVPVLVPIVLLVHVLPDEVLEPGEEIAEVDGDPFALARTEEHRVVLGEDGHAWVALDLWTHHHDEPVTVELDAPSSVQVATAAPRSSACARERCTHAFVAQPSRGDRPVAACVRVRVDEPGRHAIAVSHASARRRVSERFVIDVR